MRNRLVSLVLLAVLLGAAIGCSSTPPAAEPSPPPVTIKPIDAATLAAVNVALQQDAELAPAGIKATAAGHKVVLTGTVSSPDAKTRAETLARGVRGVTEVDNQLAVQAGP